MLQNPRKHPPWALLLLLMVPIGNYKNKARNL